MSRSRRKTPIISLTCGGFNRSEKADKKRWHKAWRRAARQDESAGEFISYRAHSNPWRMAKDGKQYLRSEDERRKCRRK